MNMAGSRQDEWVDLTKLASHSLSYFEVER